MEKMLKLLFLNNNRNQTIKTLTKNPSFRILFSQLHKASNTVISNPAIDFVLNEAKEFESSNPTESTNTHLPVTQHGETASQSSPKEADSVQLSHPWPEWVELMGQLVKRGYFDEIGNPFENEELGVKDSNLIRTACLNFARHRFDLIRYLSRKDIRVIAGSGCPSLDRKVVNSGKRLRAHVGIDEGNVCSSCLLRGDCERAYVKARHDEWGRTVDAMRIMLTYGLDPITGSVENKSCLNKNVKESVRKLLKEMVEFSKEEFDNDPTNVISSELKSSTQRSSLLQADSQFNVPTKQGDWICPKCKFLNFARNIKCLQCNGLFKERLERLGEDQDHLPLKKGDWICATCNFLNFAKNTRCLQCKEKPSTRQINPGEWECESCNYINFRRNMICLKCDHRRPKASNTGGISTRTNEDNGDSRLSRPHFRHEGITENASSNRWNFVEDQNEYQVGSNSWDEPGLFDFPVAGGKSSLSQNVQKQASWKQEMAAMGNNTGRAKENSADYKSAVMQKRSEFFEPNDDEDMAEWFGIEGSKGKRAD